MPPKLHRRTWSYEDCTSACNPPPSPGPAPPPGPKYTCQDGGRVSGPVGVELSECNNMCKPYSQLLVCDPDSWKCRQPQQGEKGVSQEDCMKACNPPPSPPPFLEV
eukprot:m.17073 g.17073  ORF g.17073 m.17073 type:complete len:106 (-) comp5893_c0_seq2:104-421(-)